ncbi:MAG: mitochondrial fission ELM1 family protein [Asticcacaulis sp.]
MIIAPPVTADSLIIPPLRRLTVWAVSDGRAGIHNQVLGLAEAIAAQVPTQIIVRHIRYRRMFDALPTALKLWPDHMLKRDSDLIGPPYPDIWIAAGRATLPHSLRMKKRSDDKTFVVQLQNPRTALKNYDLVIAPQHDQVSGDNVLSLQGATHRVTPQRLKEEHAAFAHQINALGGPYVTVLIGGKSKSRTISPERAEALAQQIKAVVKRKRATLLLSVSRRTPDAARDILINALKGRKAIIYTGEGPNPYFAFLQAADHILVTDDSVNMATEAAATGKPLHILETDRLGSGAKFDLFHKGLQDHGAARPFSGELRKWKYTPLDETARAATEVLQRFAEKYPDRAF